MICASLKDALREAETLLLDGAESVTIETLPRGRYMVTRFIESYPHE